jgi:hypothetical protein
VSGTGHALWFSLSPSWLLLLIVDDKAAGRGVAAGATLISALMASIR